MKKIIAGLFAAIMLTAGLVAFSGSASVADYTPGKLDTDTNVDAPATVDRTDRARIGVKVVASNSNAEPKGQVTITVERREGGYTFVDSQRYSGDKIWFKTGDLNKRGKYDVTAKFNGKDGSRFRNSSGTAVFRVVKVN